MTFTFGRTFKIHVFGESHGKCIGVTVEGCQPGITIDKAQIQSELDRRCPGTGELVSSRAETDIVSIDSGILDDKATGAPITMIIPNVDVDSSSYEAMKHTPRPGHADYTARIKFEGYNDYRGGGVFSGRMTAAFVMAGAIAKTVLNNMGVEVLAHVVQVGSSSLLRELSDQEIRSNVYTNEVRCADEESAKQMQEEITNARQEGDSVGGIVECRVLGISPGVGDPIFDSVESVIGHAMFSIPGAKGIEFGSGFRGASMRGSENNDPLVVVDGRPTWAKNDAGGVLGGITNGASVVFRVGFKPTPTISKVQKTVDLDRLEETTLQATGRHDPCIVPRAVPVVEGMAAVAIADLVMSAKSRSSSESRV
ncbi:MAG: chorismate synthase [Candidatus Hermodarchaeota archaeon]